MKSKTTPRFWREFAALPKDIQVHAARTYRIWRDDPSHPSLHFKRVSRSQPVYSIRIGINYRAVGRLDGDTVT